MPNQALRSARTIGIREPTRTRDRTAPGFASRGFSQSGNTLLAHGDDEVFEFTDLPISVSSLLESGSLAIIEEDAAGNQAIHFVHP